MDTNKEHYLQFAREYAELIISGKADEKKISELRTQLNFSNIQPKTSKTNHAAVSGLTQNDGQHIGIWKYETVDGENAFFKDNTMVRDFRFWADTPKIALKSKGVRIAYFGESVARGYLYDPHFSPAKYLQALLNTSSEMKEYEVTDLAKTSIFLPELLDLYRSSMILEPDMTVIFAGNNWKYSLYPLSDEEAETILEVSNDENRFEKIKIILRKKCSRIIKEFMRQINDISTERNIPVIFVIPEFNLRDWLSLGDDEILFWPGGQTGKWLTMKKDIDQALLQNDTKMAEELANKMIDVNPTNPLPYRVLAECKMKANLIDEARYYYEAARDTSIFVRDNHPPACISEIKDIIIDEAQRYGFKTVNIPQIFKEHLHGGIPGNDLFIDYCHFTSEGIQVAMKHLAESVLSLQNDKNTVVDDTNIQDMLPSSSAEAKVHFLAAIHCAHVGNQPYKSLYHHCCMSIQYSSRIIDSFRNYLNMVSGKMMWIYSKAAQFFLKTDFMTLYPILHQPHGLQTLDIELTKAMVDAMKDLKPSIKEDTDSQRIISFQPVDGNKVNLLETYFSETSYHSFITRLEYEGSRKPSYYVALGPTSKFFLITDPTNDIKLELTFRSVLPESKKEKLQININGITVGTTFAFNCWQDIYVKIPKCMLSNDGTNTLEVKWPLIDEIENDIVKENARKYCSDELALKNSRTVYGNIFRLNALILN